LSATAAHAACPIELATYNDSDNVASVEFRPTGEGAAVTNTFKVVVGEDLVLDGIIIWTQEPARSIGMVTHQCPEGDVTGDEIAACTVWEGAVYSIETSGTVGLMPAEGKPAPAQLLFAGLGYGVAQHTSFRATGFDAVPWDLFQVSGCQE
jgi:hypothetical protein